MLAAVSEGAALGSTPSVQIRKETPKLQFAIPAYPANLRLAPTPAPASVLLGMFCCFSLACSPLGPSPAGNHPEGGGPAVHLLGLGSWLHSGPRPNDLGSEQLTVPRHKQAGDQAHHFGQQIPGVLPANVNPQVPCGQDTFAISNVQRNWDPERASASPGATQLERVTQPGSRKKTGHRPRQGEGGEGRPQSGPWGLPPTCRRDCHRGRPAGACSRGGFSLSPQARALCCPLCLYPGQVQSPPSALLPTQPASGRNAGVSRRPGSQGLQS